MTDRPTHLGQLLDFTYDRTWRESKNARSVASIIKNLRTLYITMRWGSRMLGETAISDTPADLGLQLKDSLKARGYANATINRYLSCIKRSLRDAVDYGWGLHQIPVIRYLKESPPRERVVTTAELTALVQHASTQSHRVAALIAFMSETGCRLGEALELAASDVNTEEREATFRDTKNGDTRTIALTDTALGALHMVATAPHSEDVSPGFQSRAFQVSRSTFRRVWREAKKRAGLLADAELVPHCLRHTVATKLVRKGVPLPMVASYLGHKSLATTMRYTHLTAKDQEPVMEALNS